MKEVGSLATGLAPDLVMEKAGPDAYKNMVTQVVRSITYCPKENDPGPPDMVAFLKRAIPYEKAHRSGPAVTDFYNMANGYDLFRSSSRQREAKWWQDRRPDHCQLDHRSSIGP